MKNKKSIKKAIKNKYQIGKQIGRGSYGVVYSAIDTDSYDFYAIKFQFGELKEFEEELRVLHRIQKECEEYFLCIREVYISESYQAIVMEKLEGFDVKQRINSFTQSEKQHIFDKLVKAVTKLHKLGVVHKDIKLSNIWYNKGKLKLLDYGGSCIEKCSWGGTERYMQEWIFANVYEDYGKITKEDWIMNDWHSVYTVGLDLSLDDYPLFIKIKKHLTQKLIDLKIIPFGSEF